VLGLVILVSASIFYKLSVPEIGERGADGAARPGIAAAWRHAAIRRAVIAQFFYVGAQVCVFSFFILYAAHAAGLPQVAAADYLGWGCGAAFMVGRFAGTFLMRFVEPARLLRAYALASAALALVAMLCTGMLPVFAVIGIAFFMSIMFPTIFSLGIQGAGQATEMGSSLIIMSIVGGAVLPVAFGTLSDRTGNIQHGYAVPLLCFLVIGWFAYTVLKQPVARRAAQVAELDERAQGV
jgi:FHS family L-fucose permease-like MFS transporter